LYKISDGTEFVGKGLFFLPICHSTNDIAAELYEKGLVLPGTVIITDHQLSGKGQRGNRWKSAPGENLTFSLILAPDFLKAEQGFYLNIVTSLALTDLLLDLGDLFSIKWPNDLYFREKKIGGILIENSILSGKISNTLIGIGLNVNQTHFPGIENAISLKQIFAKSFDLNDILNTLLKCLDNRWRALYRNQYENLKSDYLNRLFGYQKMLKFRVGDRIIKGFLVGIDPVGRLVVRMEGEEKKFNFQEIKFLI
jgi:BirA family biotin operon repressor/biotin-[acetyl-CoA-carboxylase] ligase